MTREELLERIKGNEWSAVEFKEARRAVPKSAYETVSAFANTHGGWLVFGVGESPDGYQVVGVEHVDRVQSDFLSALRADNKVNHDIHAQAFKFDFDGKTVLAFHIPEAHRESKPVYLNGDIRRTFSRRGGCNVRGTMPEIERLLRDASSDRWDTQTFAFPLDEAFDEESVKWYRALFDRCNPGHEESLTDREFLRRWGYVLMADGVPQPTRAAVMVFGSAVAMHHMLPRPTLDVQWIPASLRDPMPETRWLDRVVFEDNLIVTWRGLVTRYVQKAEKPFSIDPHTLLRNDAPPEYRVFREAAVNLLIHQDYADHSRKAVIKFYRDAIQLWNPGDVFGPDVDLLAPGEKDVRNPRIVAAFRRLGLCEQAGTGMRMVVDQWQHIGHPTPTYDNDRTHKAFDMRLPTQPPTQSGAHSSAQSGVESGVESGAQSRAQSGAEPATQLATQSTDPVVRLMAHLVAGDKSSGELRDALGIHHRPTFRKNYLRPGLQQGAIERTIPEIPSSPLQKYRLTEKGRAQVAAHLKGLDT